MRSFATLILTTVLLSTQAIARDPDGRWANSPDRDWYRNAELTEAARKRFSFIKCCDGSDVYRTQFRVNKLSGDDEWYYLADGHWRRVPPDIIHWGISAPGGLPTLFIYQGKETCFFPGEAGG